VFNIVGEDGQVTEAVLTQDGPVLDDITAGQPGTLSDDDRGGFIWLGGLAFGGGLAAMALAAGGGGGSRRYKNNFEEQGRVDASGKPDAAEVQEAVNNATKLVEAAEGKQTEAE
ncbi:hypothetical protein Q7I54_24025, partial [Escherichia coli]